MQRTTFQQYPFGTFPVEGMFQSRYSSLYSRSRSYPLPLELPLHHPLLQALEGVYPVQDAPAPWWPDCVAAAPEFLRPLLADLSIEEFRSGVIDDPRWRSFKHTNTEALKAYSLTSPKLSQLLGVLPERSTEDSFGRGWSQPFTDRGPVSTPKALDFVISTDPAFFFNMSNGRGWSSCQCYRRNDPGSLPGNFYDTGVAIAMVLPHDADVWQRDVVIARLTLRVVRAHTHQRECIAIGNCYHNDSTSAAWMILHLIRLIEERLLPWGFIEHTFSHGYCEKGELGSMLQQRAWQKEVKAQGDPIWIPSPLSPPYLDGHAQWTNVQTGECSAWDRQQSGWHSIKLSLATPCDLG